MCMCVCAHYTCIAYLSARNNCCKADPIIDNSSRVLFLKAKKRAEFVFSQTDLIKLIARIYKKRREKLQFRINDPP